MSARTNNPNADPEPYDKVTISLPHWLLVKIDEAASKEDRKRSNWIMRQLAELMKEDHEK